MRLLPCGDAALLVELDALDDVMALHAHLRRRPPPGTLDLVPAARTLLVRVDGGTDLGDLAAHLRETTPEPLRPGDSGEVVEIAVRYEGVDLDDVGELTGLGAAGVVAAHTGQVWTVAFAGFSPGFGYLVDDGRLDVGRRPSPRTRVPAGSVALAGGYTGVYPSDSPGGWHLIGTTCARVWDVDRDPPALLSPGVRVRFVED